jgi:hypothetical protein
MEPRKLRLLWTPRETLSLDDVHRVATHGPECTCEVCLKVRKLGEEVREVLLPWPTFPSRRGG